ncbi:hypothetical protein M426DRAFT_137668 [Hypoxylon sp. CI-4A]|nr:hypothetical protein M426DRAFT_137668 [Hypoxylon sp. CI-4A]
MSGNFVIPGLTATSATQATQEQATTQNEVQPVTSQPSTEMDVDVATHSVDVSHPEQNGTEKESEIVDAVVNDAPSPPSLFSGLEAALGGLEPVSQGSSNTPAQTNGTTQNEQPPEQEQQGDPEWEEDSSPYESSSDSSSSDDSDEESEDGKNYELLGPEETARILMEMEGGSDDEGEGKAKGSGSGAQVRTKNELPEEVVPKPDVTITPEMPITELGIVEHIVENTVVVKANTTGEYQVLDTGSVLCTEDRTVIAAVADLIGNVRQPRYTAKFTNGEEIKSYNLELGTKVFYTPSHASYVFTQALQGQKGTDASNLHDEEVGDDEMEFSDDEKEAEYKRQLKAKKKGGRGGKAGTRGRGGHGEVPPSSEASGLNYEDDDGPYRKLSRPASFAQGQPAATESGYSNNHGDNGSFRGGRGRGQRGFGRGRGGRGNRGDSRGGYSLPPRPPRGQDYQAPTYQSPPVTNAQYAQPPPFPFYTPPNGHQQPNPQFPFQWPQGAPQGFVPPPPPQFTGQQPGATPYFSPELLAALQSHMQGQQGQPGQQGQQNGQWPGHGGAG